MSTEKFPIKNRFTGEVMLTAEYRAHVASEYPDTDKAAETLAILDFIDIRAKQMGVVPMAEIALASSPPITGKEN